MGQGVAQRRSNLLLKNMKPAPPEVQLSLLDLVNLLFLPFPVDETLKVSVLLDSCSLKINI